MRRFAYVYLLRCADGTIYTGWTLDVDRRVRVHQQGRGARYTRDRRPVTLIYHERLPSRREAMRREIAIKNMSRARKLALAGLTRVLSSRTSAKQGARTNRRERNTCPGGRCQGGRKG